MKIRLISVIWGEAFVDLFLGLGVRTLLAKGNIPELVKRQQVDYTIFTTLEDAARLKASPVFHRLEEIVRVNFSIFSISEIDKDHFGSHNDLWLRGIELAKRNDEAVFFLMPDIVYADGTLARWLGRLEEGKKAVYTPGPQVVLETVLDEIESRFPHAAGESISLHEDDVHDMMFRHFHPLAATMLRDSPRRILHPEHDIRAVPGKGMVFRALTSQPLCIVPGHFISIKSFNPEDHLADVAYEPCTVISAEPMLKNMGWYYRPRLLDDICLSNLGGWWDYFGTPGNIAESAHAYKISMGDKDMGAAGYRAVGEGRFFRAQIAAARLIYSLCRKLQGMGSTRAAAMLATSHYVSRLRRRLVLKGGATLLVPVNGAFEGASGARMMELAAPGNERALADLIKNHVVAAGASCTAAGMPVSDATMNANIVGGPVLVGDMTIYEIDGILWLDGAMPSALPESVAAPAAIEPVEAAPAGGRNPGEPHGFERFVLRGQALTPWALRSRRHRLLFLLLHIPFIELLFSILFPVYFHKQLREFARRIYVRMTARPFLAKIASYIRKFIGLWRVGGASQALAAVGRVLRHRAGRLGRVAAYGIDFGLRAFGYLRRNGMRATFRRVLRALFRRKAGPEVAAQRKPSLPESSHAQLATARILRGAWGLDQILEFYEDRVLAGSVQSAPRALLAKTLGDGESLSDRARHILASLAERHPEICDIHLEQGWAALDNGDRDAAMGFLRRAVESRATVGLGGLVEPQGHACAELARLHEQSGELVEAMRYYREAVERLPGRSVLRVAYADLLRQTGELAAAVDQYAGGLGYEGSHWDMPRLPRDIRNLQRELG